MSLYLKYRPQDFGNLVGQDHIVQTLINALKVGRVSHAYLFCGPRGTGKTSTARLVAKALNCTKPCENGSPCNVCDLCTQINDGRLTDIIEIDAASTRGIDEMRDLREKIGFSPNIAKFKIYIIDEVHMLTKEAFNALLKTLEEPPSHAYFILATTEIYKVPDTIISRCQRFDFHRMGKATIVERLKFIAENEGVTFEIEALESIADRVNGAMRDAIGLLEQSIKNSELSLANLKATLGLTEDQAIVDLFESIYDGGMAGGLGRINEIHNQGYDLEQMSKDFLEHSRRQLLAAVEREDAVRIKRIVEIIDTVQDAKSKIKNSSIPQLALEIAVIKLCGGISTEQSSNSDVTVVKARQIEPSAAEEEYSTTLKELESGSENDFLSKLRKNWINVVAKIKNPALRNSFKDGKAVSIKDNVLLLHFSTKFHLEKTATVSAVSEIENAIEAVYGQKLGLKTELRQVDLAPTVNDRSHGGLPVEQKTIEENPEEAVNLFESW